MVPILLAFQVAVGPTATAQVGTALPLHPKDHGIPEYVYDEARNEYDEGSNPLLVGGEGTDHPNDRALKIFAQREVVEIVIYAAAAANVTASEGAGMVSLFRGVGPGELAVIEKTGWVPALVGP